MVVTLDRHGNTSAASVPSALDEAVRDGRIQRGQLVLLEAFGGGFTRLGAGSFLIWTGRKNDAICFCFPGRGHRPLACWPNWPHSSRSLKKPSARPLPPGLRPVAAGAARPGGRTEQNQQTQPALLAASVAIFRVWQQQGGKAPALMAGHSRRILGAGLRRRAGLQGGDPSGRAARQADAGSGAGRHRRDVCHHRSGQRRDRQSV